MFSSECIDLPHQRSVLHQLNFNAFGIVKVQASTGLIVFFRLDLHSHFVQRLAIGTQVIHFKAQVVEPVHAVALGCPACLVRFEQ